jgi:hypothetical protein
MKVLAVDLSLTATGWCDRDGHGVIRTDAGTPLPARLRPGAFTDR